MTRLIRLSQRLSRQALCSQTRLYSSIVLQSTRPSLARPASITLLRDSRNFWWSSSSKITPAQDAQEQPVSQDAAPEATLDVEELPSVDSTSATEVFDASSASTELASPPGDIPLPDLSATPAVIDPLQYGDLAALGLAAWTPAGICRWSIELIHVSTGMPWFWTIVSVTVISRIVLLPFQIRSMQASARLAPYQPELAALRLDMQKAKMKGDTLGLQASALRQKMLFERAGVGMLSMLATPFVQLPVTLGMFFGIKTLCELPLEQLKHSGVEFLPDLTVADPMCILPIASAVLMNVQLLLSVKDMAVSSPYAVHMVNFFRVLSIVSIPVIWNFPSGTMVYVVTGITCLIVQTAVLRVPAVRAFLNIPIIARRESVKPASFKDSIEYVKKWWKDKKAEQEAIMKMRARRR